MIMPPVERNGSLSGAVDIEESNRGSEDQNEGSRIVHSPSSSTVQGIHKKSLNKTVNKSLEKYSLGNCDAEGHGESKSLDENEPRGAYDVDVSFADKSHPRQDENQNGPINPSSPIRCSPRPGPNQLGSFQRQAVDSKAQKARLRNLVKNMMDDKAEAEVEGDPFLLVYENIKGDDEQEDSQFSESFTRTSDTSMSSVQRRAFTARTQRARLRSLVKDMRNHKERGHENGNEYPESGARFSGTSSHSRSSSSSLFQSQSLSPKRNGERLSDLSVSSTHSSAREERRNRIQEITSSTKSTRLSPKATESKSPKNFEKVDPKAQKARLQGIVKGITIAAKTLKPPPSPPALKDKVDPKAQKARLQGIVRGIIVQNEESSEHEDDSIQPSDRREAPRNRFATMVASLMKNPISPRPEVPGSPTLSKEERRERLRELVHNVKKLDKKFHKMSPGDFDLDSNKATARTSNNSDGTGVDAVPGPPDFIDRSSSTFIFIQEADPKILETISRDDYSEEELRACFYNKAEYSEMVVDTMLTAAFLCIDEDLPETDTICRRGVDDATLESTQERRDRRQQAKWAVLYGQQLQRLQGDRDPYSLATAYKSVSRESSVLARFQGMRDQQDAII